MKEKIKEIMSEVFELPLNEFPEEITQANIDKWDSLGHLNLIVELEDVFDKSFEPEEIGEMTTLDKIIEFIQK
ncbi:acyl carrier protein [Flavobacterium sp. WG21]|uniref:acyl carrier protein n=1 Tax=Flavobacterium sp. WG21 TaxID=1229487 RepID=UPI000348A621|nr:acyl carrier protein [Flavobacterium sp. WG21]